MKQDTHGSNEEEWVGFDLDGTLAKYDGWKGIDHIGEPVTTMVVMAKTLHRLGKKIKILTARVAPREDGDGGDMAKKYVEEWCKKNLGFVPEVTYKKDASMAALFDDRAVAVEQNSGKVLGGWPDFLPKASEKAKDALRKKIDNDHIASVAEKKADAHHPDFYRIVKKLKDEYGIDLSHMRMKWSRHPRYVSGKRSYEFADDETVGSHAGDSTIYINPNLRPVMNRFGISGKISDLRRRAIAHELAHEIQATYSEAYNHEFEKKMTDEAKKKGFRTLYTDTVPERKFDKELFAEYMAHLLNKGDSLDVEKKAGIELKDGKYKDVHKIYDALTDEEKEFVTPGRTVYKDVPTLSRTVAYDGKAPVGFADTYPGKNGRSASLAIAVSDKARGKRLAGIMAHESIKKVLDKIRENREKAEREGRQAMRQFRRLPRIRKFIWDLKSENEPSARAAGHAGFKERHVLGKKWRRFVMSRNDAEKIT